MQIRGKPAKFTIRKGQEAGTHALRIQVNGVFQGHSGPVILTLDADASKLTPEKVNAMLDSIRRLTLASRWNRGLVHPSTARTATAGWPGTEASPR